MQLLNDLVVRSLPIVPRAVVRSIASRYVAGETLAQAVATVRALNAEGCMATLDVLGEDIVGLSETAATVEEYRRALEAIAANGLDSNVSVKLTALGLKLDPAHCRAELAKILEAAKRHGNFVRIDMEDSSVTEATIGIWRDQFSRGEPVGLVLQAYLHRSLADARDAASRKGNVRVCKGIYVEPPEIAYQGREEIRDNYAAMVEELLSGGAYVGIATHDTILVERALATIRRLKLPRERYEFQMLLGVAGTLRRRLVAQGHRLRVYVPYGDSWYAYSVRRLKENPSIAGHVIKGLLTRGR
ncbi:MAG TPA: proline dehydrogenase family protein [Thermoanaerobaculia bacterium]